MELIGTGIRLTLAFPPDTDTPGFEKEQLTKPNETKLISGSGGLHSPDEIGKKIIHDAMVIILYIWITFKESLNVSVFIHFQV
jgi:3-dehydrosphinganine reductase